MATAEQHRPSCPVCGRWQRRDHRCPGPPLEDVALEDELKPAAYHSAPFLKKYGG